MTAWDSTRRMGWPTKAVIALGLLAVLLVAVVPAALLVGVILMLLGHVVGGLALFGASVLAAVAAVVIASVTGVRHLRSLVTRHGVSRPAYPVVQLHQSEYDYR